MYAIKHLTASYRAVDPGYVAAADETLVPYQPNPAPGQIFDPLVGWRPRTAAELDAFKDLEIGDRLALDKIFKLLFQINFDQENRLRTLQSLPTITSTQYRNAILAAYRALNGS